MVVKDEFYIGQVNSENKPHGFGLIKKEWESHLDPRDSEDSLL